MYKSVGVSIGEVKTIWRIRMFLYGDNYGIILYDSYEERSLVDSFDFVFQSILGSI